MRFIYLENETVVSIKIGNEIKIYRINNLELKQRLNEIVRGGNDE